MAITCPDLHLCAQGVLYLVSIFLGCLVAVPLLVSYFNFHKQCILYAEFTNGKDTIHASMSNSTSCIYPIGISAVCLLYGLGMTVWYYKAFARRGPDAGSQMPTLLPLLANCVMSVTIFISSCIISVGFKIMCDRLEKAHHNRESCVNALKGTWNVQDTHMNGEGFYPCIQVAEIASWTCFLVLAAQAVLGILRLYRDRRMSSRQAADMNNFASAEPTA